MDLLKKKENKNLAINIIVILSLLLPFNLYLEFKENGKDFNSIFLHFI